MSLIRKHVAVLQAWACLDLVIWQMTKVSLGNDFHQTTLLPADNHSVALAEC